MSGGSAWRGRAWRPPLSANFARRLRHPSGPSSKLRERFCTPIGGAFRVPEVMAKAGGSLREVGTTNRTRIADYERAINERTRALLRVHRSNFQMVGFTEQPSLAQLVAVARKRNIPLVEDLGSGALFDMR